MANKASVVNFIVKSDSHSKLIDLKTTGQDASGRYIGTNGIRWNLK